MSDIETLKSLLIYHPDFPKPGINFVDIFPLFRDPLAFETLITHLVHHLVSSTLPTLGVKKLDVIVGLDARGFLLGPLVALRMGAAFVPVRKKGKLPGKCHSVEYTKEYGTDTLEMQADSFPQGSSVVVIDDLIATGTIVALYTMVYRNRPPDVSTFTAGGTAKAAGELVKKQGGTVLEYLFVVGLPFLKGTDGLDAPSYVMINSD